MGQKSGGGKSMWVARSLAKHCKKFGSRISKQVHLRDKRWSEKGTLAHNPR